MGYSLLTPQGSTLVPVCQNGVYTFITWPAFGSDFCDSGGFIFSFPQERDLLRIGDENFTPALL